MTVAEIEPQIIVEALDKSFKLEDFSLDDLDPLIFKWELGGITDPFGQLSAWIVETITGAISDLGLDIWGWLTTIRDQITSAFSGLLSSLQSALELAINSVGSAIDSLSQSFDSFVSFVEGSISTLQDAISNLSVSVAGVVTAVESAISGIIADIQNLADSISGFISTVINQISALSSSIYNYITSFGETIVNAVSALESWITQGFDELTQGITSMATQVISAIQSLPDVFSQAITGLTEWLQSAFTTVSMSLAQFGTSLTSFGQQIVSLFNQMGATLSDLANQIVSGVTQTWGKVQNFLEQKYQQLVAGLQDVNSVLQGFVNPLVEIKNWLTTQVGVIITPISQLFEKPTDKLAEFGTMVWSGIVETGQTVWGYIQGFTDWVQEAFQGAINAVVGKLSEVIGLSIGEPLKIASERIKSIPEGMGEVDIISYVAQGYSIEAAKQMAALAVAEAAGEAAGEQEVSVEPVGLGAKIKVKLGAFLKTIAKYLKDIVSDSLKYSFAGITFWTVEPVRYYIYQRLRNSLPVQLPTITEMIEFTRRRLPTDEFEEFLTKAKEVLALRGYSDWVISTIFEKAEELYIKIRDRFNRERVIPLATLYDLPTKSDWARMMIRDIIINFDDFKKAMAVVGINPDIAFLYYLLHYRYPTLEHLWQFYRRGKAGMLKIDDLYLTPDEQKMIAQGFGARPAPPNTFNFEAAEKLVPMIAQYAKWHDYAFFGWKEGFPSDRLIVMELMADIPQRIDSRWMYKWGIIKDEDVKRVVVARGFHDDWIEPITIAECMNALAEERTYVRTGVVNAFKEGFSTERQLTESFKKLATVKILGKEIPVRFLDSETKLLALRAKYDRALDILRDYHRDLVKSYEENIVSWDKVTEALKRTTEALAKGLGIRISLDEQYYKLYAPVAESLRGVYTVRRIRYWLRYMMRTILSRFERGYISKSEISQMIDEIADFAKMTDAEKEALIEVGDMLLTVFNREMLARGILRKLSRGVISVDEAKSKLKDLGLEDDVIDAMIEYNAKTYTLTLSQLISYMEYVPVSQDMLKRKIEMLGVPPDEAKLIPAYAIAREVSSEVGRLVTELITDYAKGLITKEQLKKEFDDIATLWGKARELGVDWLVLSPQEREILILLAEKRRQRELARKQT